MKLINLGFAPILAAASMVAPAVACDHHCQFARGQLDAGQFARQVQQFEQQQQFERELRELRRQSDLMNWYIIAQPPRTATPYRNIE